MNRSPTHTALRRFISNHRRYWNRGSPIPNSTCSPRVAAERDKLNHSSDPTFLLLLLPWIFLFLVAR